MRIMITGIAGMIGFHTALSLTKDGHQVFGIDNFNDYYEPQLKRDRAKILGHNGILVIESDLLYFDWNACLEGRVDAIIHLAAYANPRHSLEFPQMYIDTNITGTQRLISALEQKADDIPVIYASSSCVMHGQPLPWNEHDRPGHQNNPYGWSKRVNECQFMHSKLKSSTGLRFFTVYGPYGRPDMALFLFTKWILNDEPVILYNNGNMVRDFTYVDDIVEGVKLAVYERFLSNKRVHDIYNIGYGEQVNLMDFLQEIEKNLGKKAKYDFRPPHPADVPATWSDTTKIQKSLGYKPTTNVKTGISNFINWYKEYYGV